jgi:hypothetical protein
VEALAVPQANAALRAAQQRAATEVARLEHQLEKYGAGLGV